MRRCQAQPRAGALLLVDACQSLPHLPVKRDGLGADFLVGLLPQKLCGPYRLASSGGGGAARRRCAFLGGGEMIQTLLPREPAAGPTCPIVLNARGTPAIGEAWVWERPLTPQHTPPRSQSTAGSDTHRPAVRRLQAMRAEDLGPPRATTGSRDPGTLFSVEGLHANRPRPCLEPAASASASGHH